MKFLIVLFLFINLLFGIPNFLKNYKLVWSDEFDGKELNLSKWDYRYLGKRKLGFNSKKAIVIKNGILSIKTFKKGKRFYTGMISTQKSFKTIFGYFEARVKVPYIKGIQSAFWLQSEYYGKYINFPGISGVEIDIFEYIYKTPKNVYFTIHWDGYGKMHKKIHKIIFYPKILDNSWHKFGLLWTEKGYTLFIDDKAYSHINGPVSFVKEYIVLSSELTKWAGKIEENKLPVEFQVDYVRVYKKVNK